MATAEDAEGYGTVLGPNPFDLEDDRQLHSSIKWDKAEQAAQEKVIQLDAKTQRMPADTFLDTDEKVIAHSIGLFDIRAQVLMVFVRPKPYELVLAYTAKAIISNIQKQGGRERYDLLRKVEERLQQRQEHWISLARAAEARRLAGASVDNPFGELQEVPSVDLGKIPQGGQPAEVADERCLGRSHMTASPSMCFDGTVCCGTWPSVRREQLGALGWDADHPGALRELSQGGTSAPRSWLGGRP